MAMIQTLPNAPKSSKIEGKINTSFLLAISFTAALGGLLFGFDFSVISGGIHLIKNHFGVDEMGEGFLGASLYIGCIIGALLAGKLSDRYGRKYVLALAAILFAISCLGASLSPTISLFIINRLIGGIGVGIASIISPLYIAEIAPENSRGKMVSINQLAIVIGILITYFSNYFFLKTFGNESWRWMIGIGTVPSLLFLVAVLFIPESPRWLLAKHQSTEALNVLGKIGDESYARAEASKIEEGIQHEEEASLKELFHPRMKVVLTIGIVLAVFQQWCGINVIFTYAPKIFASAGYSDKDGLWQTVIIGVVNLLVTFIAMALVDKVGRRKLLLIGSLSLVFIYLLLGALFYTGHEQGIGLLILLLAAIAAYGVSLAPVTWVINSEIFPNRLRGVALSFATMFLWIACFVLVQTFPWLFKKLEGAWSFWLFSVISLLGCLFIWKKVPETKGKSLEELEQELIG